MVSLCVVRHVSPFVVGVGSMLEIVHIRVTSHFFWFKWEKLDDLTQNGCIAPPATACSCSQPLLSPVTQGEVLVTLLRPVCLRGDVPIVSLATQWVGKKNISFRSRRLVTNFMWWFHT